MNNREQLLRRISAVGFLSDKVKGSLYDYFHTLEEEYQLCHGDFHPENVFISDGKFVVFDWSTATIGSKYSDVAHTNLL